MYSPKVKAGVFVLEGLNGVATTYYFYYLYFFTQSKFGFDRFQNLLLAAALGLLYTFGSIIGGRFAQKRGYFFALKIGFGIMAVTLSVGSQLDSLAGHFVVMVVCNQGMCFTWPTLEALVSEGKGRRRLQTMVGIYNLVWALGGALAYLTGGAMIESWGLRSLFVVPAAIFMIQLAFAVWLERQAGQRQTKSIDVSLDSDSETDVTESLRSPISRKTFLKMAWLANPFTYLAINTVVAVSPSLAKTLNLTPKYAGYYCSIWMFTRAASFLFFWLWSGWHYRFRWLLNAYLGMIVGFVLILLSPNLTMLIASQIAFGACIGLIYYSSLFYSMDVGETKGEHGGFHEAAIGVGSCAGPAVGAASLYFAPGNPHHSTFAVGALLVAGLVGLVWLRRRNQPRN